MIKFIIAGPDVYSEKERARAILFNSANIDDFVKSFEFCGVIYYKKIK